MAQSGMGAGMLAVADLLARDSPAQAARADNPLAPRPPNLPPRQKKKKRSRPKKGL